MSCAPFYLSAQAFMRPLKVNSLPIFFQVEVVRVPFSASGLDAFIIYNTRGYSSACFVQGRATHIVDSPRDVKQGRRFRDITHTSSSSRSRFLRTTVTCSVACRPRGTRDSISSTSESNVCCRILRRDGYSAPRECSRALVCPLPCPGKRRQSSEA